MRWLAALVCCVGFGPMIDEPTDRAERSESIAWPAGPLEVRIVSPEPVAASSLSGIEGRQIPYQSGGMDSEQEGENPLGQVRIAGVSLADEGRTLILLTDPHPAEATYRVELPEGLGSIAYDLTGVEAIWTPETRSDSEWTGWLPELDLEAARSRLAASVEHEEAFGRMSRAGSLTLRTLLAMPDGETTVVIQADRPFEAELMYVPLEVDANHRAEQVVDPFGEPVELFLTVPTGPDWDGRLPELTVQVLADGDDAPRPIGRSDQILPWAPAPIAAPSELPSLPENLAGGDPSRGETVFFGEQGKCADCHRVGDRGGQVGPDLSDIGKRFSTAEIYREIEAPSAVIAPDYLPYTVAMRDGRVLVGVVRAEGLDRLRVVGADAEEVDLSRSEIEEIQPVSTSIMPVGLAGALGQQDLRDLLAYLAARRGE
ncbi:c-type cytochrome [Tautonia marina]|uniref:c-type cytochrome n=1 Tax=Tautonia marina TaxID=2653855 RepID=UPI001260BFA8|nr:c-type cytochrome [Tautonia marina]